MRNLSTYLKTRNIDTKKLEKYGFERKDDKYIYTKKVLDDEFEVEIELDDDFRATSKIIDLIINEEYPLVDVTDAVGEFVGNVREAYETIIQDFISKCTISEIFKTKQSKQVIEYITNKYGDELGFLWEKYDNNAIWRNKENKKWYGLIMKISEFKLGIESNSEIEVLNLMYPKGKTDEIIDRVGIFPAYHMNKNSWITIKLDGVIETERIYELIDSSYNLSLRRTK